jgi:hypothetical protein
VDQYKGIADHTGSASLTLCEAIPTISQSFTHSFHNPPRGLQALWEYWRESDAKQLALKDYTIRRRSLGGMLKETFGNDTKYHMSDEKCMHSAEFGTV